MWQGLPAPATCISSARRYLHESFLNPGSGFAGVRRAINAMFSAAEFVSISRHPSVDALRERADPRNTEDPGYERSARENIERSLHRGSSLPRFIPRPDQLNRLEVGLRTDPWESIAYPGGLRRNCFDLFSAVDLLDTSNQALAHLAGSVVDECVWPARSVSGGRLPGDDELNHGNAQDFTSMAISGGWLSVW